MPDAPPFSPTVALLTLARSWEAALTDALRPLGLTTRKYGLLGHIRGTPGISFSELARRSRITVQSAHAAVGAFAADGLVEDASAHAGTASRLQVTDQGEQLLQEAARRVAGLDARFAAEQSEFAEALRRETARVMQQRSNLQLD